MRILVGTKMAQVEGTVSGANPGEAIGASVMLVPEDPSGMEGRRSAFVDKTGRFSVTGLAPGRYRLYAVAAGGTGALLQNPRVLKALEGFGTEVNAEAGGHSTAQLQVVSGEELARAFQEVE